MYLLRGVNLMAGVFMKCMYLVNGATLIITELPIESLTCKICRFKLFEFRHKFVLKC